MKVEFYSESYDHVWSDNEWNINKRVVSNKDMYTRKKYQKLKRVYMFIRNSRVMNIFKGLWDIL